MTVEVVYSLPKIGAASMWQVRIAEQIEANQGFSIAEIERKLDGSTLTVRVGTTLPSTGVQNMLADIEDYLPTGSKHLDTREV